MQEVGRGLRRQNTSLFFAGKKSTRYLLTFLGKAFMQALFHISLLIQ